MLAKRQMRVWALAVLATVSACSSDAETRKPDRIIATEYGSIQEAIDAARRLEVYHIYVPSGVYDIHKTLNFTGLTWSPVYRETPQGREMIPRNKTVTFEGAGRSTILIARTGDTPAMDLSGCQPMMIMRNFVLQTPFIDDPEKGRHWAKGASVGVFMARIKTPTIAPSSGGHYFENVTIAGGYGTAAILSWDSETNRFVNCSIRNTMGHGFVFTDHNREGIRSPYVENAPSCNTELRFYGTKLGASGEGSAALRLSGASDVSIHGGYVSTGPDAFAGVYLDGTIRVCHVSLRDMRMECRGKHCLYAVGAVSDILIEGGQWISQKGEMILHEDQVHGSDPAHRAVFSRKTIGRAQNWTIRNFRPSRNFEADPNLKLRAGRFRAMRFDSLQDSVIEQISFQSQYVVTDKEGGRSVVVASDIPLVEVTKYSRRNLFRVPSRESVVLSGDAKNNQIIAIADDTDEPVPSLWLSGRSSWYQDRRAPTAPRSYDGTHRTYVRPDQGFALLNLGIMDVLKIDRPKAGDLAIHDGTGLADGKPCLVLFDGSAWRALVPGPEIGRQRER